MIVCIDFADLGIEQMCALVDESPAGAFDYDSIIHRIPKRNSVLIQCTTFDGWCIFMFV